MSLFHPNRGHLSGWLPFLQAASIVLGVLVKLFAFAWRTESGSSFLGGHPRRISFSRWIPRFRIYSANCRIWNYMREWEGMFSLDPS